MEREERLEVRGGEGEGEREMAPESMSQNDRRFKQMIERERGRKNGARGRKKVKRRETER